ncbi:magnesium transport protein transmembrane region [Diplodia corticola]|uniref:Magnesium transport protein transmembrane region n=1 Tax=Diplodia corticola TaxID=236234 RepID=A0A1J9SEW9_9PEZI|nr:magnesium transport protein transmembrane region [Diplodia corticola]OJD38959.1 magnesium transport protein transmembrane region [Diplodia corticola]
MAEEIKSLPFSDYPLNLPDDFALGQDRVQYQDRLNKHIRSISAKKTVNFQVFESTPGSQLPIQRVVEDQQSACQAISESRSGELDCRIFSFVQKDSLRPFLVTAPLLWELLDAYQLPLPFLDVLFAVHTETCISEESYGNVFLQKSTEPSPSFGKPHSEGSVVWSGLTSVQELSYQFKYAEANNRSRAFPWSIRRTEVFNRIETSSHGLRSTWLIFNPKEDSDLSRRLNHKALEPNEWSALKANPLRLHISILSAYIDNWRDFLADIGKQYSELKKLVWTADIESEVSFSETLSFKSMRSLRGLEERVQSVQVTLRQTEKLVQTLQELNHSMLQNDAYAQTEFTITANALKTVMIRLEGYQTSAEALELRVQGILRLVTDALNVKNQTAAAKVQKFAADNQAVSTEISKGVYALAMDSVDDSTIARIVTLATLIYLPASFVASLFGMNFFDFDEGSRRMNISKDAWIYLLVTIPLTAVTGLAWWCAARRQRMKRASRRQPPDV